jgi:hypothetical protein
MPILDGLELGVVNEKESVENGIETSMDRKDSKMRSYLRKL